MRVTGLSDSGDYSILSHLLQLRKPPTPTSSASPLGTVLGPGDAQSDMVSVPQELIPTEEMTS